MNPDNLLRNLLPVFAGARTKPEDSDSSIFANFFKKDCFDWAESISAFIIGETPHLIPVWLH